MKQKRLLVVILTVGIILTSFATLQVQGAGVKLNYKKATLNKGESLTLKLKGAKKVKWSSSKKAVASVTSKGKVTAKKKGTAKITAKVGKKKYTCIVKVETPKLSKTKLTLDVGKSATLKVNGTSQSIKWSSSKKSIATVTNKGVVSAVAKGNTTIIAKVGNTSYKCNVVVNENNTSIPDVPIETQKDYSSVYNTLKNHIMIYGTNSTANNSYLYIVADTVKNDKSKCSWRLNYNPSTNIMTFVTFIGDSKTYIPSIYTLAFTVDMNECKKADFTFDYYNGDKGFTSEMSYVLGDEINTDNVKFTVTDPPKDSSVNTQQITLQNYVFCMLTWDSVMQENLGISMSDLGF